jgi:hypothetical protein
LQEAAEKLAHPTQTTLGLHSALDLPLLKVFKEKSMLETSNSDSQTSAGFLAEMYARWTLDCLVEIAHAIAIDYFSSPEFYLGKAPDNIVDLWLSYGSVKNFPNKDQRHILAGAIFGDSDGYPPKGATAYDDAFHKNRDTLFKACIAAQTATSAQSRDGLNQNVVQALPALQSYLGGFPGIAALVAYDQIQDVSDTAFAILRSDTVSSRFIGTHSSISDEWPLKKSDPNGDKLIAECVSKLKVEGVDLPKDFPSLRALAQAGNEALEAIVDQTTDLDDLITKTYSWAMFTGGYEPYTGKQ